MKERGAEREKTTDRRGRGDEKGVREKRQGKSEKWKERG
jgi:hypothetical protein